jgi:DNA-directed RNA polymerase I, II, and III subunit RPABC2
MTDREEPIDEIEIDMIETEVEDESDADTTENELEEGENEEESETEDEDEEQPGIEEEEEVEEDEVVPEEEAVEDEEEDAFMDGGSAKNKKKARRNKNSKVIDLKTLHSIAGGGITQNIKLGDEESEVNLRKFESEISNDYLISYHPEIKTHNYDEITTLSTIVRNQEGQIVDNFHKTLPFLSKFEKARILGVRSKQINSGASVMIDVPENVIDGYTIAIMEYEEKKIPFIIKRPLPDGTVEYWKFADFEQINL